MLHQAPGGAGEEPVPLHVCFSSGSTGAGEGKLPPADHSKDHFAPLAKEFQIRELISMLAKPFKVCNAL